jgi:hypothetical protein
VTSPPLSTRTGRRPTLRFAAAGYGVSWLFDDCQALRLRPIVVDASALTPG